MNYRYLEYPFDKDTLIGWFSKFGNTDAEYLLAHFGRFRSTYEFSQKDRPYESERVLDIGAHWLHQAFFFANVGHEIVAVDASVTFSMPSVKRVASEIGAELIPSKRLDNAEGFAVIPDHSITLVLMCEVIEHLTFNPIRMWKEIYRVMKPGGRIIITTPNVYYLPEFRKKMSSIMTGNGLGISVEEIFSNGTRGHHWKEFSGAELRKYFKLLSDDFETTRLEYVSTRSSATPHKPIGFESGLALSVNTSAESIFQEVTLVKKANGIVIKAPWEVD